MNIYGNPYENENNMVECTNLIEGREGLPTIILGDFNLNREGVTREADKWEGAWIINKETPYTYVSDVGAMTEIDFTITNQIMGRTE